MELYSGLFDSMLVYCQGTWLRRGPVYTFAMMALALAACLNLLSVIDTLWILGVLRNPYHAGALPSHNLCGLLYVVFLLNSILARRHLHSAGIGNRPILQPASPGCLAAPLYLVASAILFLGTTMASLGLAQAP